jgi:4-hydroxy-3-polyprenylbenzoate decarboxylase
MCYCTFESAAHWLVVTVDQSYRTQYTATELTQQLGKALFSSRSGSFIPKVILLEDDIDATNLDEVIWAFATRCHPVTGAVLFPDQPVLPLVAYLTPDERRQARATKVIYNCLPPDDVPKDQMPRRSSFRYLWPPEVQAKVIENWSRYGYPEDR